MELKGAVAIVTGGSGGLGGRICHALARAGSIVAVGYNNGQGQAEMIAQEIRDAGTQSEAFRCDVTDSPHVEELVSQVVDKFGRVDVLVNDAAYNKWIPFTDLDALTLEDWTKIITINLTGPMLCAKAVAPVMKRQGSGRIVNISSVAGLAPSGSSIAYAVSKAGLNHLTKCLAVALAPNILVNCIAPGFLEGTRMSANLTPEYQRQVVEGSLLRRAASKDDIAEQVTEFCRTDSITGQTLVIDAGRIFH